MSRPLQVAPVVFVRDLAIAAGCSDETIHRRMKLWDTQPNHPLAIPYLKKLGRPYRTTRAVAERLFGLEIPA